jgi:hypothetical protein
MSVMNKREVIDAIRRLNPSAGSEFLARFGEAELVKYLQQLQSVAGGQRECKEDMPMLAGHI